MATIIGLLVTEVMDGSDEIIDAVEFRGDVVGTAKLKDEYYVVLPTRYREDTVKDVVLYKQFKDCVAKVFVNKDDAKHFKAIGFTPSLESEPSKKAKAKKANKAKK